LLGSVDLLFIKVEQSFLYIQLRLERELLRLHGGWVDVYSIGQELRKEELGVLFDEGFGGDDDLRDFDQ